MVEIKKLLDARGRLTALPKRQAPRQAALLWLLRPFEHGRFYSEEEVNGILTSNSAMPDYALLRRALADSGLLTRTNNGSRYWRTDFLQGELQCGKITLRDMAETGLPSLLRIHETLGYYDKISGEPFSQADAEGILRKTDLPPGGSSEFFSAKIIIDSAHGEPVGYLACYEGYPQPDTLWVASLFIGREHQHDGIGGAVMQEVEAAAGKSNFTHAGLGVYAQNTPGLQFWVGQGFKSIGKVTVNGRQKCILSLAKDLTIS